MKYLITGAAGFTGANLTEYIAGLGHTVYAIVRPGSPNNNRISDLSNVHIVELDMKDFYLIREKIHEADVFIHLLWNGSRFDKEASKASADCVIEAVEQAHKLGCKRIVITGSQAEYGATNMVQTEDIETNPFDEYGKAKVDACNRSKKRAEELGIEWVWGRIFSLIGKYEPDGRLFPHMIKTVLRGDQLKLSSCRQNWDYLDVRDAVRAIEALVQDGKAGEIYNIANGNYKPLKEFVIEVKNILKSQSQLMFGEDPEPFVSLQPSTKKIYKDTGWEADISFEKSVLDAINNICIKY